MRPSRAIADRAGCAALAAGAVALFAGCPGSCPTCPQVDLASGTFVTTVPGGPGGGTPAGAFPWGSEPKTLALDVAGRTVQVRYVRDGHEVVETWRVSALSQCPP